MKIPIGSKIQELEKIIIEELKETELVDHPRFYMGNLKSSKEPIKLLYKVSDTYRSSDKDFDPLFEIFPIKEVLTKDYPGVLELNSYYEPNSEVRTMQFSLTNSNIDDITEFKYNFLLKFKDKIEDYLVMTGKKNSKKKDKGYKK